MTGTSLNTITWILDSGVSRHMTHLPFILQNMQKLQKPFSYNNTGTSTLVENMGYVHLLNNIMLHNVFFILEFSCNLISIHKLTCDLNCSVTYDKTSYIIQGQALTKKIGFGDLHKGIYVLSRQHMLDS